MLQGQSNPVPMKILLVEDNRGDVELIQDAFVDAQIPIRTYTAGDGEQALSFLRRKDDYSDAPRPDLVLLDLNIPRKSGQEVLSYMKKDEQLKDIPVIMLSSSEAHQDISQCYRLHANAYVVKPVDYNELQRMLMLIEQFWFGVVALPAERAARR